MKTDVTLLAVLKSELTLGHVSIVLPCKFVATLVDDVEAGEEARLALEGYREAVERLDDEDVGVTA